MMIGHANLQLQKMTDRYLLIHDPLRPLELSVIDNYQAGEVRSAKNLSGGESFIVSLALALGLSGIPVITSGSIHCFLMKGSVHSMKMRWISHLKRWQVYSRKEN